MTFEDLIKEFPRPWRQECGTKIVDADGMTVMGLDIHSHPVERGRMEALIGELIVGLVNETEPGGIMTGEQVKHMVDRFLGWRLPSTFNPDAGISYTRPNYALNVDAMPYGTNLLDAGQAEAMVRHMIEGLP